MQMRTVALQELVLAVQVLLDGKQFTSGIASAVCAHIQQVLRKEQLLHSPNCDIYLEHAQLLPLIPLLDLVDFLWFQLGLRFSSLPLVDSVRRRLFEVRDKCHVCSLS